MTYLNLLHQQEQNKLFILQKYDKYISIKDVDAVLNNDTEGLLAKIGADKIKDQAKHIFEEIKNNKQTEININPLKYIDLLSLDEEKTKIFILFLSLIKYIKNFGSKDFVDKKHEIKNFIATQYDLIKKDFEDMLSIKKDIEKIQEKEVAGKKIKTYQIYYKQEMIGALKDIKKKSTNERNVIFDRPKEEKEWIDNLLRGDEDSEQKEEVKKIADQINYFHEVQKSLKVGDYITSLEDRKRIFNIIRDLKLGRTVALLGETGSGKTELALLISRLYLKQEPILLSGNRDTTYEDLTLEKIITSRSIVPDQEDGKKMIERAAGKKNMNIEEFKNDSIKDFFTKIIRSEEFKLCLNKLSKEKNIDISMDRYTEDMMKYNLFTEYHYKGLFKAMVLGRPFIIDEVNIIKPEIIMGLNHYLTRKIGQTIELPNGLGTFTVKEGFCVIFTGNDSDAYSGSDRYKQGRYSFDQALYNRMTTYAKDYAKQEMNKEFNEKKITGESQKDVLDYVNDNEMYRLVVMMMFDKSSDIMHSGKFGFDIIKKNFVDKNETTQELKVKFFMELKNLSQAIYMIQKAYTGKSIILSKLNNSLPVSEMIKRKVFSMRDLRRVLERYKTSNLPLEYFLYHVFIGTTTNEEERYALLAIFHEFGFFTNLVSDDKDQTLSIVKKEMDKLVSYEKYLSTAHIEKSLLSKEDIKYKLTFTKQDIYPTLFGHEFDIDDEFFLNIPKDKLQKIQEENGGEDLEIIEYSNLDFKNTIKNFQENLSAYEYKINDALMYFELLKITQILEEKSDEIRGDSRNTVVRAINNINSVFENDEISEEDLKEYLNQLKDIAYMK